jgi:hypothetical protein
VKRFVRNPYVLAGLLAFPAAAVMAITRAGEDASLLIAVIFMIPVILRERFREARGSREPTDAARSKGSR